MDIKDFFKENKNVAVAFSGGVDSAVLLMLAKKYAGNVRAYFVKTQFQPAFELEDAKEIASLLGAELEIIRLNALGNETVAANPPDRCYHCKKTIFGAIIKKAHEDGFETVIDGTNASDDEGDRPGMRAIREYGVRSPLKECGLTKGKIRAVAAEASLPVAGKPSYACLATRVPTGTPITEEILKTTEKAEGELASLGFRNFRVRWNGGEAKLELGKAEFGLLFEKRSEVLETLLKHYKGVTLDLKERKDE